VQQSGLRGAWRLKEHRKHKVSTELWSQFSCTNSRRGKCSFSFHRCWWYSQQIRVHCLQTGASFFPVLSNKEVAIGLVSQEWKKEAATCCMVAGGLRIVTVSVW